MKARKTGIRTLQTWCVYDPITRDVHDFCATKKVAKLVAKPEHVIVRMKGTYAMPRTKNEEFSS